MITKYYRLYNNKEIVIHTYEGHCKQFLKYVVLIT